MFLSKAQCTGEVRLLGAHIGGQLDCSEASFTNPDGQALNADRLVVDGDMFLDKAQCTGEVRLPGAHIGGQLAARRPASPTPRASPDRRRAGRRRQTCSCKAQCTGEVRLPGAHIGGQLNCTEASFTNPAATP